MVNITARRMKVVKVSELKSVDSRNVFCNLSSHITLRYVVGEVSRSFTPVNVPILHYMNYQKYEIFLEKWVVGHKLFTSSLMY